MQLLIKGDSLESIHEELKCPDCHSKQLAQVKGNIVRCVSCNDLYRVRHSHSVLWWALLNTAFMLIACALFAFAVDHFLLLAIPFLALFICLAFIFYYLFQFHSDAKLEKLSTSDIKKAAN